jgi:predicted kinase
VSVDGLKQLRADICFQDLQVSQSKVLSKLRLVWRHLLYIAAMRLEDGDLLIVPTAHDPDKAINDRVIGKFNDIDSCYVLDMSVARYR